jgi:CheY-like chemotaxis protein
MQVADLPRRLRLRTCGDREQIVVEITDSGPGIPSAVRTRIFDPFFTTKSMGGTGVGLSVSRGIIGAHGGTIEALPASGGGALFRIVLPAADQQSMADEELLPTDTNGRPGRILVIDDEPEICRLLGETLAMAGHAVQVAASGREAMALLETGSFDLIVSDLRMPDLDGPGLHRHLRQHRPELLRRLIFITGDVLSADYDGMIAQDDITVLEKPIDLAALSTLVAQLLSAGSEP